MRCAAKRRFSAFAVIAFAIALQGGLTLLSGVLLLLAVPLVLGWIIRSANRERAEAEAEAQAVASSDTRLRSEVIRTVLTKPLPSQRSNGQRSWLIGIGRGAGVIGASARVSDSRGAASERLCVRRSGVQARPAGISVDVLPS